jgi:hypothetical protein
MADLRGSNICVVDLETLRSADDCRWCARAPGDHLDTQSHVYTPLGWEDHVALGLSIGCWYYYCDGNLHWFDKYTLEATIRFWVEHQPLLVGFNSIAFDFSLCRALLRQQAETLAMESPMGLDEPLSKLLLDLCDQFNALCATSYDILAAIWKVDPERKFERGLNSLDALSRVNGYGAKEMTGSEAPRLWAQGRYAAVLNYCAGDVRTTMALFEQVLATGSLVRGDGRALALARPQHPEVSYA